MFEPGLKILTFSLILLIGLAAGIQNPQQDQVEDRRLIEEVETDSIRYELFVLEDAEGKDMQYMAEIFTPVCHTDKCYPVYINFYWDLLGNFQHFEMPEGEILTKLDHIPFEEKDYDKLEAILSNKNSILGDYSISDLVVSTTTAETNGVDAVTGATSKTIQNEVISGAVYSCYTLWQLAHGSLSERTKTHTLNHYTDETLVRFLESGHHPYQYWALDKIQEMGAENDPRFARPLLEIIRGNNIFLATHLLEELPVEMFQDQERQVWFWETYEQSPYRLQMHILDKMSHLRLNSECQSQLLGQLERSNPAQRKKLFTVLGTQQNLGKEQQEMILAYLDKGLWEKELLSLLQIQKKPQKSVKKALKNNLNKNQ
ncbi:hypothetical protein [Cyclobacterium plantarum]|uniref:hypothetical protein n=1 Tax=Cyclobacterium plantarum TaxID=2716263 RepID=UPI003F6F64D6